MSGSTGSRKLMLELSQGDAAILAAALRQYEPYWSPDDPDAAAQLSRLAQDVMELLNRLRAIEPTRPPGLLGTFSRNEPTLRLAGSKARPDPRDRG